MIPADSTDEAVTVQRSVWQRLAPSDRVRLAVQMSDDARRIALAGLAARRLHLTPDERIRELILLMHGVDITHTTRS